MISVDQALDQILNLLEPLEVEEVPLAQASGRILARDVFAQRDQPPFSASAMDGYAVRLGDIDTGKPLEVIGESAAGGRFDGTLGPYQAVRIFTGAPVPEGADHILIQEDCTRDGAQITPHDNRDHSSYIRPRGGDFSQGTPLKAPVRLGPAEISLLASMNIATLPVRRRPIVALIATGDELVAVGETPDANQIISSNNYGLKALIEGLGAVARILPIAHDNADDLTAVLNMSQPSDLIVTLGGASVGDYDLVQSTAQEMGLETAFYKVAMRPGKPLMAGRLRSTPMIGLPGNPVSAMVCGHVFIRPALNALLGLGRSALPSQPASLSRDIPPNGPRRHYMRATLENIDGKLSVQPLSRQDSSLLSVLQQANALLIREANAPAAKQGDLIEVIPL
ncbi:molybdopterin molybdenumtransferase MoeA [Amylibacter marinus]|uniref:Molybdopterin molybdenumtransferase n=1 Tax=Amylibacter marinus TaxID=1475483 RepID=A0ABQ5VSZ4_9RHOB|nr:gephyrin-like molybdotransferase Glp [Amylibacter marinus]GLQ34387.1 molybdopterin molybdenumtransferase MoeA [Amylibacter marinus]